MVRDTLSKDKALKRISSQIPLHIKCQRANYVIDNTGERGFTEQQTYQLFYDMKRTSRLCGLYKWIIIIIVLLCVAAIIIYA